MKTNFHKKNVETRFQVEADMNSEMAYLSIGSNLKLAPVSCAILEWPKLAPLG